MCAETVAIGTADFQPIETVAIRFWHGVWWRISYQIRKDILPLLTDFFWEDGSAFKSGKD